MKIYIIRDSQYGRGYLSAQTFKPDPTQVSPSIEEFRVTNTFPEELWDEVLAGKLPVDEDGGNDSTWIKFWPDAEVVWSREQGVDV